MVNTETKAAPKTPTDDKVESKPARKRRFRVLGEGEGDYCIYQIVGAGHKAHPEGTLLPIVGTPRFEHTQNAWRWAKTESGDVLAGKQIAIIRFCKIGAATVETKQVVALTEKPPVLVRDSDESAEDTKA